MSMIKIENLTFSYPTSYDNVFENVSFQVDTDWKLGFVGRNGRGKTTFLNLLLGKYEYSGKILSSVQFDYFPYPVSDKNRITEDILQEICPLAEEWELMRELSYLDVDVDVLWRPSGYYIEQYFYAHNVRFIAVTDQFDTADPGNLHGGIMLPLKNMINEAYSLDIGRKIKAQARQAMKDGDYIGARAPYGYRKDPDNCHKLLIDENTAPVVKQIFEWAYERVALNRIVRNLNEMGIAAPSHYKKSTGEITSPGLIGSGKWQTRTVMKILESEVYTGDLVQGKTKMVDHRQVKADDDNLIIARHTHEPIISHELFIAVQEYRKQVCEESRAVHKRAYTPNIFKSKVFCADCGRSLHRQRAERKKGPDIYWFHCLTNSRVAKDTCKGVMMQETELIATVTTILEKELSVALGMSLPLFQLEARQKQKKDGLKSAKRQEIEKQRRLIRGLYENFVQGILTSEEYFELKAGYEESITALSGDIEALEKEMDALDDQLVRYRAMEKDVKSLAQDHVLTAELIERLIERIEIDHERNIRVSFRFKSEFQGEAAK